VNIFHLTPLDLSEYNQPEMSLKAYYGLPRNILFCKRCVISNQRPNSAVEYEHTGRSKKQTIHFDREGVCDACRVAEQKNTSIDWAERDHLLRELCDQYRSRCGYYDCLLPGSGGKDSSYASHLLKTRYGMHPLTVTWAPHIYTEWGWKNFQSWIHTGFDNILVTPNGRIHRLLTRLAVENLLHPFQPFIIGQKALAPKLAIRHKIPLIFYGENEAEYGNPIADSSAAERDWSYFTAADPSQVFLGGTSIADLKQHFGVVDQDLLPYLPANPAEIQRENIRVHYLGYYTRWHPQGSYYYAVSNAKFQASPERTPGTYSKYNSIDDRIDDFHYYTTFIKFGIGRATYDAAQEIRSGEITREEGVALVKKFDGEFPTRFEEEIYQYLSLPADEFPEASRWFEQPIMDAAYFMELADQFRSPHLWRNDRGAWKLRKTVCYEELFHEHAAI
jgi:N-acetyl sugar amidotransferase